jgi:hypothetical protein
MSLNPTESRPATPPAPIEPFKDAGAALQYFRKLKAPFGDEQREHFLGRLKISPSPKYIAFTILSEGFRPKQGGIFPLLRPSLKDVLSAGRTYPGLDTLTKDSLRSRWLEAEFGITGRLEDAARYNGSHSYLWPLYVIISAPENEAWLCSALDQFMVLLEASLEIGQGKSGNRKTPEIVAAGRAIATEIARSVSQNAISVKGLRSQVRSVILASTLVRVERSSNELRAEQARVLEGLLDKERARTEELSEKVRQVEKALALQNEEMLVLKDQLAKADLIRTAGEARAESKLKEELMKQRGQVQFLLREGLNNILLYTDRAEPNKDRILAITTELLGRLDNLKNS